MKLREESMKTPRQDLKGGVASRRLALQRMAAMLAAGVAPFGDLSAGDLGQNGRVTSEVHSSRPRRTPKLTVQQSKGVNMGNVRDKLIGAWRMIDWRIDQAGVSVDPPLGPVGECGGLLIYTEAGVMSAMLSKKKRMRFSGNSLDGGTVEEKKIAYETIISYAGTYEVDEASSAVVHHVEYATFPNFVGQDLRRLCIFDGNTLKLDTPPMEFGGKSMASFILWERIG
ncbi:lipocalin-like domain-containing protein [Cupriavidus necator]